MDQIKYNYYIKYDRKRILYEKLDYYPEGYKNILFIREKGEILLKSKFINKRIDKNILETHLFLTKAGNSGHKQMGEILLNFKKFEIKNALNPDHINRLINDNAKLIVDLDDTYFSKKLNLLIKIADIQIDKITVKEISKNKNKYRTLSVHKSFSDRILIGEELLPLTEESAGTKILFALGGLIIKVLRDGGVLFIDEFHNSLHPSLCRFLVRLFHHPKTNLKKAQLILASHESALIDKGLFRKDQVWFTEKNQFGETELYSIKDFRGIREDMPFSTLYKRGKFRALPKIKQLEYIFDKDDI
jgi:hypothetical protein